MKELRELLKGTNTKGFYYMGYAIDDLPEDVLRMIHVDLAKANKRI